MRIQNFSTRLARGGPETAKSSQPRKEKKEKRRGCVRCAREISNILKGEAAPNCQLTLIGTPNNSRKNGHLNSILNYFQPSVPRPIQLPPANLGEIQFRHLNNRKCKESIAMFNSECEKQKYFIALGNEPHAPKGTISGLNRRHNLFYKYKENKENCLLYTSPSPRDGLLSRMPSSA